MNEITKPLEADQRVLKQLSDSAIQKDPIRAVVELITNSDDSYKRLEEKGIVTSGRIQIEINRKKVGTIIRVLDDAEGFDADTMDQRIGKFGVDTSGLTQGNNVRGYFGRGLKEAIIGLGEGKIFSIKHKIVNECFLDKELIYHRKDSKNRNLFIPELKKYDFEKSGTLVEISVLKDGIKIPQYDTFLYQIGRYFSLRDIISSTKRRVFIIEKNDKEQVKRISPKLEYKNPIGSEILNKKNLNIQDFNDAKFDIQLFYANDDLDQNGYCREGGVLIKGKSSIHSISLLGFDGDPIAQKLFGIVKCDFIDDLLKKDESIISDRRDDLDWSHPFGKALKKTIECEIRPLLLKIKKDEETDRKAIENEKTRQRFQNAIEKINEIAFKELEIEGEGKKPDGEEKLPFSPPNGFDFIPEFYHIIAGRRHSLTLKGFIGTPLKNNAEILFESESDDIVFEEKTLRVDTEKAINQILTLNPRIYGKSVGAEALVTAKVDNYKAVAYIKVVANIERKKHHEKKGFQKKGLINSIEIDDTLGPKVRSYFDSKTGIVKISSKHPSVEIYLGPGPNYLGQDELHCQVLFAELVTDSVCKEIARKKFDQGKLQVLGERMDAIYREHNNLINKYAHMIHQYLVAPAARRIRNLEK